MDSVEAAQGEPDGKPKSSAEWVELLVQQMAGAKDLDDARSRATQILQAFEQAVLQQASQVCLLQACRPPGSVCVVDLDVLICIGSVNHVPLSLCSVPLKLPLKSLLGPKSNHH